MQAGITNPLQKTFRIYDPNKNILDRDSGCDFIHKWVPELKQYSAEQILSKKYLDDNNYIKEMLDFKETKRLNGKIISDIRAKVRSRIIKEKGLDFEEAKVQKKVTQKYDKFKTKKYLEADKQDVLF
jgi:deoxyribodipyrimidine photo-lyase